MPPHLDLLRYLRSSASVPALTPMPGRDVDHVRTFVRAAAVVTAGVTAVVTTVRTVAMVLDSDDGIIGGGGGGGGGGGIVRASVNWWPPLLVMESLWIALGLLVSHELLHLVSVVPFAGVEGILPCEPSLVPFI